MSDNLTPKQEAFCLAYVETGNASEAYRRCYDVKPDTKPEGIWVSACELLKNPKVAVRVAELQEEARKRNAVTVDRVVQELAKIGFSDIRKLFSDAGHLLPPGEWPEEAAGAVSSLEVVAKPSAETDEKGHKIVEHVHKIKVWDKNSALEKLAKHLGMFVDRVEHTGKNGGPIETRELSDLELARRIAFKLNSAVNQKEKQDEQD